MIDEHGEQLIECWKMKCRRCSKIVNLKGMSFRQGYTDKHERFHWINGCDGCGFDGELWLDYDLVKRTGVDRVSFGLLIVIQEKAL